MPGATVTFAVTSGGGNVTGATQTTNSAGIATVGGWTLGSIPGTNTLTATVSGLTPLTFTATSMDPCTIAGPHTVGETIHGTLASGDCRFDGAYFDFYRTTLTAGTYVFDQTSTFDTYLYMSTELGAPVAVNDDIRGDNRNSRLKVILPAGTYILAASSYGDATGAYTFASASTTAEVRCEEVFVMKGISTAQSWRPGDCSNNQVYDDYSIFLNSGETITVTMTSSTAAAVLTLLHPDGSTRGTSNVDGTNTARIAYTAPEAGLFVIHAESVGGPTGEYTLVIE